VTRPWTGWSFERRLLAVACAALVVRVVATLALTGDDPGSGDFVFYHEVANSLVDGTGFVQPLILAAEGIAEPTAEHPPLWPVVLALASAFGADTVVAHRLVGCVVGAVVVAVVGLLGRRVGGDRVGLVAAGLAAAYPTLIAADGSLMSETLYGLFVALALLATLRALERPSTGRVAAIGLACGLAALTRAEALLLVVLLAGIVGLRARQAAVPWLRPVVVVGVAAALTIAPWTLRNLVVFERPVLISTNDSSVLAGANCDATYRGRDIGFWRIDCISERRGDLDESEQQAVWRREGLDRALGDPVGALAVVPVRLARTWDLFQPGRQVAFAEGRDRGLQRLGLATYYVLLVLAAYGVVLLRRRGGLPLVLLAPLLLVCLSTVLGFGMPRFRHAAEVPLLVLGAVAVAALAPRLRGADPVRLLPRVEPAQPAGEGAVPAARAEG
jgi:4-amino-4-deoxy-L-arabinose transferase-like glycosyltransferase